MRGGGRNRNDWPDHCKRLPQDKSIAKYRMLDSGVAVSTDVHLRQRLGKEIDLISLDALFSQLSRLGNR